MANLLDYVAWRGDLPFSVVPFNDIDALVLCQITYLDISGLVSSDFNRPVTLRDLAELFKNAKDYSRRANAGAMINAQTVQILLAAGASERFGGITAAGYVNRIDLKKEEQFAAVVYFIGDKRTFVVYRGTDDTIVGWKEDFNLAVMDTVPAQTDALSYLTSALESLPGRFCIAGHSKGGNLAVYAGALVAAKYRKRIESIYNLDGPGFKEEIIASPDFQVVVPKLRSFYPQFSIIGMLFSHAGAYTVVESDQAGIMQHDPFSWHVTSSGFVTLSGFDEKGVRLMKTVNEWYLQISPEEREKFVETLFKVIQVTDARTNSELEQNWLKNSAKIVHALISLDPDTRGAVMKMMQLLFKTARQNMPELKGLPGAQKKIGSKRSSSSD